MKPSAVLSFRLANERTGWAHRPLVCAEHLSHHRRCQQSQFSFSSDLPPITMSASVLGIRKKFLMRFNQNC
uniref:Uncharacterized protein n=1 Tax=Anguilla anguilla TaxID=7936 RepID=A0A0E9X750_ANGAN